MDETLGFREGLGSLEIVAVLELVKALLPNVSLRGNELEVIYDEVPALELVSVLVLPRLSDVTNTDGTGLFVVLEVSDSLELCELSRVPELKTFELKEVLTLLEEGGSGKWFEEDGMLNVLDRRALLKSEKLIELSGLVELANELTRREPEEVLELWS